MKIKKIHLLLLSTLIFSSCNQTFYQVYSMRSDDFKKESSLLVYENEDCTVSYNLWSEYGNPGFEIYNKTDKDLFLVLPQSFYIENGVSYDYYENKISSKSNIALRAFKKNISISSGAYPIWDREYSKFIGQSSQVSYIEKPIICIAPKSYKWIFKYWIKDSFDKSSNNKINHPKLKSVLAKYDDKQSSPLNIRSRISYSFDKNGDDVKTIDNSFWLSEIANYSKRGAMDVARIRDDDYYEDPVEKFKINSPDKFYVQYEYNIFIGVHK